MDALVAGVKASLDRDLAPLKVSFGRTTLRYADQGYGLAMRLTDIRIVDEAGVTIAQAPSAAVGLSSEALLAFAVAPSSIELLQPKLLLTVTRDNALSLRSARSVPVAPDKDGVLAPALTTDATNKPLQVDALLRDVLGSAGQTSGNVSYLRSLGLRDALVVLDVHGQRSIWGLPALEARRGPATDGTDHIQTQGTVVTAEGAFGFAADIGASEGDGFRIAYSFNDLVPAQIGDAAPPLAGLKILAAPVSAQGTLELGSNGAIQAATGKIVSSAATVTTEAPCSTPFNLDSVHLDFAYGPAGLEIAPSQVATNIGQAIIKGRLVPPPADAPAPDAGWRYDLTLSDAALGSGDEGFAPLAFAGARLKGRADPATGLLTLDRMSVPIGGGAINVAGRVVDGSVRLEGAIEGMTGEELKRLWPACMAVDARQWLRRNLQAASIGKARFAVVHRPPAAVADGADAVAVGVEAALSDMAFTAIEGMPPVTANAASLTYNGRDYTVTAPSASMVLAKDKTITFKDGHFNIPDLWDPRPIGTFTGTITSSFETALAFLDHKPLQILQQEGVAVPALTGQQTGNWTVAFPIIHGLKPDDFAVSGRMKVKQLRTADGAEGAVAVRGGTLDLDVKPSAISLAGDVLINGVNFKVAGQHVPKWAPPQDGIEPNPLTLSALLDDAARDQLGIPVNHIVRGDIPVRIVQATAKPDAAAASGSAKPVEPAPYARVEADLSAAELVLDTMAWRKPPGADASLSFDVEPGPKAGTRFSNFRLVGSDIGIGGAIDLTAKNKLAAFSFPTFSIDVVTQLSLEGQMRPDNVLSVTAEGRTFDGRKLIRSLFSAGRVTEKDLPPSRDSEGIDLEARIGTLIGANDTALHDLRVSLSRRQGKLTALRVAGTLDGGAPVAIGLGAGSDRTLVAESKDAGGAFKLVGLYRNMEGGEATLQVDLDSDSALEKSGTLWARRFAVLGDTVVDEMMTKTPGNDAPDVVKRRKGPGKRQRIEFQNLRVPFRVGGGKLQLGESFINGPLLGATLRGTVDFSGERVSLAGTYVPLFGLNAMFAGVPLIGDLLGGSKGIFGVTFAIEGPSERPQVLVNPISMVAPGIFRSIFEFDPGSTKVPDERPRKKKRAARPAGASASDVQQTGPTVGDGFEAQTSPN